MTREGSDDMDEKGVFNDAALGDEFLLVGLGGEEIAMVYNLKLFEFSEWEFPT